MISLKSIDLYMIFMKILQETWVLLGTLEQPGWLASQLAVNLDGQLPTQLWWYKVHSPNAQLAESGATLQGRPEADQETKRRPTRPTQLETQEAKHKTGQSNVIIAKLGLEGPETLLHVSKQNLT